MDTATLEQTSDTIASLQGIQTTPFDRLTTERVAGIVARIVSAEHDHLKVEVSLFQSAI